MGVWITVFLTATVVGYLPPSIVAICGQKEGMPFAKFPQDNHLMSMADFINHIVDREFTEMYYALPVPQKYSPEINYISRITNINGTSYKQSTYSESQGANPRCVRTTYTLKHIPGDRALFLFENSPRGTAFWSSCPSEYYWSMRCKKYGPRKQTCSFSDTDIGLFLSGSLNDVPMLDIVQDLCRATGVKFGAWNYKWIYSYGNTTLC